MANSHQFIAATFTSYEQARAAVQSLRNAGYNRFTATYIEGPSGQAAAADDGLFNSPDDMASTQMAAMTASGIQPPSGLPERLAMMGVPEEYRDSYLASILGGQVLAVIRSRDSVPAMMSQLSGFATSIRTF
ncbi:hypothetical protein [Effusibacillus lacus]|uniref:General stress protein 17M-like domain-containing protein n=1 Tax=Effusibacillus lacus TaxID=1348429 RepID=A0A292YP41_9BACL|nr:hypothetical protein [Effusibacillus lacus]TCS72270.1 hypothetical protein EDD64_12222 [Effusibacillus lacus]GAX90255.1 hypothetical protein EFBL_1881 [Effusibacillus lacus]